MSLWSLFLNHDKRTAHKWKHYFPVYERRFGRFVSRPCLIEIGSGRGGSLQLWKSYLGPHAQIINPDCPTFEEDQIAVRIGDQSDPKVLGSVIDEFGTPDIVPDDGGHVMRHVLASFSFLYRRTSPTSVYMVEHLHTAYWPKYGGGLRHDDSFIEIAKGLIDELNADHARDALAPTEFTLSMHFYDSVCVFERDRHLAKRAPEIGSSSFEDCRTESNTAKWSGAQQSSNPMRASRNAAQQSQNAIGRLPLENLPLPTLTL